MPGLGDKLLVLLVPCGQRGGKGMPTESPQSARHVGWRTPRSNQPPGGRNTAAENQAVYEMLAYDVAAARDNPAVPIP